MGVFFPGKGLSREFVYEDFITQLTKSLIELLI